jgi:hypothetical protein
MLTHDNNNINIRGFFAQPRAIAVSGKISFLGESILRVTHIHGLLVQADFSLFYAYIKGLDWSYLMRLTGLNLANTQRKIHAITDIVWAALVDDDLMDEVLGSANS